MTLSDDVSGRAFADARCRIAMQPETVAQVRANALKKGDVLGTARFAGIQAALGVPAAVTLSATSSFDEITVNFAVAESAIDVAVHVEGPVGSTLEPYALTAAAVAALTIYDMCKAVDHTMVVELLSLVE